ncbi:MAG: tetratricopeptide repeat protein [Paracoccaceae bacterium]
MRHALTAGATGQPSHARLGGRRALRLAAAGLLALGLAACDSAEERAEGHYQNGVELLEAGETAKAMVEFRNATKLNREHAGAILEIGKLTQADGNFGAAVNRFRRVIELDGTLWEAHLRLGQIMLAAGELDDALKASNAAFAMAPEDVDVLTLKASTALQLDNDEVAGETARTAIALDPTEDGPWVVLAAYERKTKDDKSALDVVDEALSQRTDSVALRLYRIDLLTALERTDEIGDELRGLIALEPDTVGFRQALVRWNLREGQFEEAEENMRAMAELEPDNTARALDVARLLLRLKGIDAAKAELEGLIETAADDFERLDFGLALVEIEMAQGFQAEAKQRMKDMIDNLSDEDAVNSARVALARVRFAEEDIENGVLLLNAVLATDEKHAKALTMMARVDIQEEQYERAIRRLRQSLNEQPDDVETLLVLALAHQRNGSNDLAGERLATAVEVSGYDVRPVIAYAQFLIGEGKIDFADGLLSDALRRRPSSRMLLEAFARVKLRQQDYAGAEDVARRMKELGDETPLTDQILAAAYSGQERFDESVELLKSAPTTSSNTAVTNISAIVATYMRANKLDEARAFIENILSDNPENAEALRMQGVIALAADQDLVAAGEKFAAAVAADPSVPASYAAHARFLAGTGRAAEALPVLRDGIEQTDSASLRLNLAMLLEQTGDVDSAIEEYRTLFEQQPGSMVVANNLASLLSDHKPTPENIERAYVIAKRLRDSDVPHFQDTYGWVLHLRGDNEQALQAISRAAEALPNNALVRYHHGVVLAELGQRPQARAELEAAIELMQNQPLPVLDAAKARLATLETAAPATGSQN